MGHCLPRAVAEIKGYVLAGAGFSREGYGEPLQVRVGLMVATLARLVVKPVVGMKWRIPAPPLQSCWYQVVPVLRMPGAWFSACDG